MLRPAALILAALFVLPGCSTLEGTRKELREKYVGKPLSVAIADLGYPSKEIRVGDNQILFWRSAFQNGGFELRMEVDKGGTVIGESVEW